MSKKEIFNSVTHLLNTVSKKISQDTAFQKENQYILKSALEGKIQKTLSVCGPPRSFFGTFLSHHSSMPREYIQWPEKGVERSGVRFGCIAAIKIPVIHPIQRFGVFPISQTSRYFSVQPTMNDDNKKCMYGGVPFGHETQAQTRKENSDESYA
jgi:hypothetical protein